MATTCSKTNSALLERIEAMHQENQECLRQLTELFNAGSSPKPVTLRSVTSRPKPTALTQRQQLILKLISENRTNASIADMLGYSESLIRQETIRIYDFLDCSGRHEATQIYLRSNTDSQSAS